MEIKQIKELMAVMRRTGTKRLSLKKEGIEIQLEQHERHEFDSSFEGNEESLMRDDSSSHRAAVALSRGKEIPVAPHTPVPPAQRQEETASVYVTSPMVGTFYSSPTPEEPAYIKVGEKIEKHTVVCIIEAMKVMNEVKSGVSGVVAEILVENGQPVEFGTKLFRIT